MGIRFSVLASGSTGNAMVVDGGDGKVLIDAGLSAKKVDQISCSRSGGCRRRSWMRFW